MAERLLRLSVSALLASGIVVERHGISCEKVAGFELYMDSSSATTESQVARSAGAARCAQRGAVGGWRVVFAGGIRGAVGGGRAVRAEGCAQRGAVGGWRGA
ncbi:hypothetical protein GCM10010407_05820 [Rarobacter incanus]